MSKGLFYDGGICRSHLAFSFNEKEKIGRREKINKKARQGTLLERTLKITSYALNHMSVSVRSSVLLDSTKTGLETKGYFVGQAIPNPTNENLKAYLSYSTSITLLFIYCQVIHHTYCIGKL